MVPTSVILVFLSWTVSLLSNVAPLLSSSIWKVKQCISYCMQEIGHTLISLFLYNAIIFADWIKNWLFERKIGSYRTVMKYVGRLILGFSAFLHSCAICECWIERGVKEKCGFSVTTPSFSIIEENHEIPVQNTWL